MNNGLALPREHARRQCLAKKKSTLNLVDVVVLVDFLDHVPVAREAVGEGDKVAGLRGGGVMFRVLSRKGDIRPPEREGTLVDLH